MESAFGPTFMAIMEWNLTTEAESLPASVSIPIALEEQELVDSDYSISKVKPTFVEIYPFQLTDETAEMLGRPVIYAEDISQALQITSIFCWSIIANEEID